MGLFSCLTDVVGSGLELFAHTPIMSAAKAVGHGYAGVKDAIMGDTHGAVEHGTEAFMSTLGWGLSAAHNVGGKVLSGVEGLVGLNNAAQTVAKNEPGVEYPSLGEFVGKKVADTVVGEEKPGEHHESSTLGKIGGALASVIGPGMSFGPAGVVASAIGGRWLGDKLGGLFGGGGGHEGGHDAAPAAAHE